MLTIMSVLMVPEAWADRPMSLRLDGDTMKRGLGRSVDVEGFLAVAGAPSPTGQGLYGLVQPYSWQDDAWVPEAPIVAPFPGEFPSFGADVDIADDGQTLAVGAPGLGSVLLYERIDGVWVEAHELVGAQGFFGWQVALGDGFVAVGDGAAQGWVFFETDTGWSDEPVPVDGGQLAAMGATLATATVAEGTVRTFEVIEPEVLALAPPEQRSFGFGTAMAFGTEDRLVVGHPQESQVEVLQRDATGWLVASELERGESGTGYGMTVAAFGDAVAVGAPFDFGEAPNNGAVYMYLELEGGTVFVDKLVSPASVKSDIALGTSLAMGRSLVWAGAPGEDVHGDTTGAVYVWEVGTDPCLVDFDLDGSVGSSDLALLLASWGDVPVASPFGYVDVVVGPERVADGIVDSYDLAFLLSSWGTCP